MKIKPGRYLTGDGKVAVVHRRPVDMCSGFQWEGPVMGRVTHSWRDNGSWEWHAGESGPLDLVKRLPDPEPTKPKAKAAKWGVWLPCPNRKAAQYRAKAYRDMVTWGDKAKAVARRLP
jgi:hypothetical protein